MNASNEEQQATETTSASFGERLRQAREARQLSIDDLVGETRINPQHLIDLEAGNTSGISAPGYIVGYLKTLAKVLGLDAEELISDFKSSTNQSKHQTIDPDHELLPPKPKKNSLGWGTIVATTIIVLAGAGALIYYWLEIAGNDSTNSSQSEIVDDESSELDNSEQVNPTPEARSTPGSAGQSSRTVDRDLDATSSAAANTTEDASSESSVGSSAGDGLENPADTNGTSSSSEHTSTDWEELMNLTQLSPGDESVDSDTELQQEDSNDNEDSTQETTDTDEADEATQEEPMLVFEFSDDSFVEVTDANDNQLVSETKQAGSKLELDGTAPFTIKLGSVRGVTLFFLGDEVDLTPHTRRNIAELTLPP
ncbi:MAG: helix-turn-helix domain-containing protein [Gammaproteobacteria bacterium]|nr:helix-turn-helix domain-containing protein [Gammaproteobacteria bacterium]